MSSKLAFPVSPLEIAAADMLAELERQAEEDRLHAPKVDAEELREVGITGEVDLIRLAAAAIRSFAGRDDRLGPIVEELLRIRNSQ